MHHPLSRQKGFSELPRDRHLGFGTESSWFSSAFEKPHLFQRPPSSTLSFVLTSAYKHSQLGPGIALK